MFDDGVGVILINWDSTDVDAFDIGNVLKSNVNNDGIVE